MPDSLKTILQDYSDEYRKAEFPHDFISLKTLEYIGKVPDKMYSDSTVVLEDKYQPEYIYNVKEECLTYLKIDCKGLYEILLIFQKECLNLFKIDPLSILTLPSLIEASLENFVVLFMLIKFF